MTRAEGTPESPTTEEGPGRRAPAEAAEVPEVPDFERALSELEEILEALDREDLRLNEALALFERGVTHLRTANRMLERARGAVEELIQEASGELRTVDLPAEEDRQGGPDAG